MQWPEWWDWQLEINSHCLKRMQDRIFNEADLRAMLDDATNLVEQVHGTYIVETLHEALRWEVIVTRDYENQVTIVVTAHPNPK